MFLPSEIPEGETSGPSRNSSITTRGLSSACSSAVSRSLVTTTPCASSQTIVLHNIGCTKGIERVLDLFSVGTGKTLRRRNTGIAHNLLAKSLDPSI
jgi:hypothetical protein